jgi:hypothetical protein
MDGGPGRPFSGHVTEALLGGGRQADGGALLGDIPFPFLKRGYRWAVIYAPAIRTARVTKRSKIRPVRGPLPRPDRGLAAKVERAARVSKESSSRRTPWLWSNAYFSWNLRPRLTLCPTPSSPPLSDRRRTQGQPAPRCPQRLRENSVCFPAGSVPCVRRCPSQPATSRPGTALA